MACCSSGGPAALETRPDMLDRPDAAVTTATGTTGPTVRAAAVCVRDARKTYPLNKTPVLDGLNMAVAEGTM